LIRIKKAMDESRYAMQHRDQQPAVAGHLFVANTVLSFVQDTFNGNADYSDVERRCKQFSLDSTLADCRQLEGMKGPNEAEYADIAAHDGADAAIQIYDGVKGHYPAENIVREDVLNRLGLESVYLSQPARAIEIMRVNVHAYPDSSNAWESLGAAYEAAGNKPLALQGYKKALTLNPSNQAAIDAAKKLGSPQ